MDLNNIYPVSTNNIMNSITITAMDKTDPKMMKKYIKREFKHLFGKIDGIQIFPEDENNYSKVTVYLRDTADEEVLEKRRFIKSRIIENGSSGLFISNKTPSTIRKWVLVLSTDFSVETDHAQKLRILNDQSNHAMRVIREIQEAADKRFELLENELTQQKLDNKVHVDELNQKIENQKIVIYQLLGGLFNHSEQKNILNKHIDTLDGETDESFVTVSSRWEYYPTTRQGDALEEQLDECCILVNDLKARTERYEEVVDELIGGLFNRTTQEKSLYYHRDLLHGTVTDIVLKNTSKWDDLPTTRQGDLMERKMAVVEKHLANIRQRIGADSD
jgi:hypothetical protein